MILEGLNFAATSLISARRHWREIDQSVRLWSRARRCASAWAEHEDHCKAFMETEIATSAGGGIAVVLGSGLVRDVPIRVLSERFDEVWLVDLQHLASVQAWARVSRLRNLRFIQRDLMEGLDFLHDAKVELTISANLLSQLGMGAERSGGDPATVIRSHVEALTALPGRRLLITDMAYTILDREGHVVESRDLMHGVALPDHRTSWLWTVAPYGEIDPGHKAVHRVVAISFTK